MANSFFNASGTPAAGASGASAPVRSEFAAIAQAFDKLPSLTAAGDRLVHVNTGSTSLQAATRVTIDANGVLTVGTRNLQASTAPGAYIAANGDPFTTPLVLESNGVGSPGAWIWNRTTTGNPVFAAFSTEAGTLFGTTRGSIDYDRTGGLTRYNTTSDYRLKDVFGPVEGALATVESMRPWLGRMHGASIDRPMFVAHELQAAAPYAVSGSKDEVDAEGKPVYQMVDHASLVPLLTAAVQELSARVRQLESIIMGQANAQLAAAQDAAKGSAGG